MCAHACDAGDVRRSIVAILRGQRASIMNPRRAMHVHSGNCCCASSLRVDSSGRSYGVPPCPVEGGTPQNLQKSEVNHRIGRRKLTTKLGLAHLDQGKVGKDKRFEVVRRKEGRHQG